LKTGAIMRIEPSSEILTKADRPEVPDTKYFLTRDEFDKAVGKDFIKHANRTLEKGQMFMVGLSHGKSPSGAYRYIFEHYSELKNPQNIRYTFVNSPTLRQRDTDGVMDAREFVKKMFRTGLVRREQIIGYNFNRESLEAYAADFNQSVSNFLKEHGKEGFDYVFLACNPSGRVAAIDRNSKAFDSTDIAVIVNDRREKELTGTPYFLKLSKRIAFLATKADKRRPLAWLYAADAKKNESPGFLRYVPNIQKRMTVFIDDTALTWPQIEVVRETPYGNSVIRVDTANPYNENAKEKLPVIILIHGFLGLNSFDGLLATIPSHQYIAAAMHYGSIPNDLPPSEYSHHIARNINAVVDHFGSNGHPVYIFDHSMGNIYFMMIDRELDKYPAVKKYLKGRIGANPFFGEESKHAILGFLDNVILPALSFAKGIAAKTLIVTLRRMIPLDTKSGVRRRGINLSDWLISKESSMRDRIWGAAKERILYLMTNMDSLPHLNRIPIERALNRLPAKVFAIQTHSALEQSIVFDKQIGLLNIPKRNIPVLILKSERDGVARFVPRMYQGKNIEIVDVTNEQEHDLFREHLYHMVNPERTSEIIDNFIQRTLSQESEQ
jgi:6-phosphogluconolactonase/glucosamine-6-phosphate isomerase/deaminase/pimeloyl-ACP methyl ester carboxylesterase